MKDLRPVTRTEKLNELMGRSANDPAHPSYNAILWIKNQFKAYISENESTLVDLGAGTGRILFQLLREGFKGTVFTVDAQESQIRGLLSNFAHSGFQNITLVPLISYVSELSENAYIRTIQGSNGDVKEIPNPFYSGATKATKVDYVLATDAFHEFFSMVALDKESIPVGQEAYLKTLYFIASVLNDNGLFFFQDIHGIKKNQKLAYKTKDDKSGLVEELIKFITVPTYNLSEEFQFPDQIESDRAYWTQGRRKILTDLVTENKSPSFKKKVMANVLLEAAYRVVEGYGDLDYEVHCGLTGSELFRDVEASGLSRIQTYVFDGERALRFLEKYAGIIVESSLPPIYSAAVFRKDKLII